MGITPAEQWNSYPGPPLPVITDDRRLDILLAEIPDNHGICTVTKRGIRVGGRYFADVSLIGLEGQPVYLRHDPADVGSLFVFSQDRRRFICKARDLDLLDVATRNDLARTAASLKSLKQNAFKKQMRAYTRDVRNVSREGLEYYRAIRPQFVNTSS